MPSPLDIKSGYQLVALLIMALPAIIAAVAAAAGAIIGYRNARELARGNAKLDENTAITKQARDGVNGVLEAAVKAAREEGHAAGLKAANTSRTEGKAS